MFSVPLPSPPVPTMSIAPSGAVTGLHLNYGLREGSDAEVGTRLDRYDDAARARRRRAA